MPLPSIDGVFYQVRLKWLIEGQECFNVLSFKSMGVQDLIDDLVTPILSCVTTHLLPVLTGNVTLVGADVKSLTGGVAQEADVPSGVVGGSGVGDNMPSAVAAVIALNSSHPGRSGKGRMFLPGIDERNAEGSVLDATFIAAAVAFIACMIAAFHDADPLATPKFHWMVHSRKDAAFYPIQTAVPRPTLSYLRSRKHGT